MAYAVIAGASGASKTTVPIGGTSWDVYIFASLAGGSLAIAQPGDVDYLIVGAGGASSPTSYGASGGGSGGDVLAGTQAVPAGMLAITVGQGGTSSETAATPGGASSALGLTARGGGIGGGFGGGAAILPTDGGGGGARDADESLFGAAHPTSYRGGDGTRVSGGRKHSGGGRGAGGNGGDADADTAGAGGPGILSAITGLAVDYGAGGTGRVWDLNVNVPTEAETPTLPGHGGPGVTSRSYLAGSPGAGGVVILRVPAPTEAPADATAEAAGALGLAGSASVTAEASGAASGGFRVLGAATATARAAAAAQGGIGLGGASSAAAAARVAAADTLRLDGAAVGVTRAGAGIGRAAGSMSLAGRGAGTVRIGGTASGAVPLAGHAAGAAAVLGAAAGALDL
ncbi:hypothetical protein BYZ73_20645, partial [Rhodovulum viride]